MPTNNTKPKEEIKRVRICTHIKIFPNGITIPIKTHIAKLKPKSKKDDITNNKKRSP